MSSLVLRFLNRLLPTPAHRGVFFFALMLGVLRLASIAPNTIAITLTLAMAASLILEVRILWRFNRMRWARAAVRCVRSIRKTFSISPMLKMFYLITLLSAVLNLTYLIALGKASDINGAAFGVAFGAAFSIAGIIDFLRVVIALTRFAWARTVGKAALALASVTSAWLAGVMADHAIANVTAMNPKFFDVSGKLLIGFFSPIVYVGICAFFVLLMSTCFSLVLAITAGAYRMVPFRMNPKTKASVAYRLVHGRNRPMGTPSPFFDWNSPILLLRPLAVVAASFILLITMAQLSRL